MPRSEFAESNSMVPSDAGGVTFAPTPALANQYGAGMDRPSAVR